MRAWGSIVAAVCVALACSTASGAAAAPLKPPSAFRLEASNGYVIHAIASDGEGREPDGLLLLVARPHAGVLYFARAGVRVGETSISADLGGIGSLDLHFVPSGTTRVERSACGRGRVEFAGGAYEGTVDFRGEEGYAAARAGRVRGELGFAASSTCGGAVDDGFGGHAPGARLTARGGAGRARTEFVAAKNSPTRPARFEASIEERRQGLFIDRAVDSSAAPGSFRFDVSAGSATVAPPAPFSATARLLDGPAGRSRLRGALAVDFPGNSNVSLAGGDTRAGLVRYVRNPGHPFRPAARPRRSRSPSADPSRSPFLELSGTPSADAFESPFADPPSLASPMFSRVAG